MPPTKRVRSRCYGPKTKADAGPDGDGLTPKSVDGIYMLVCELQELVRELITHVYPWDNFKQALKIYLAISS